MKKTILIITFLLTVVITHAQSILSVDAGGNGAYTTISAAVAAATDGDVLQIYAGIYSEAVDAGDKKLYYIGQDDASSIIVSATTFKVATGSTVKNITFASGNTFDVNTIGTDRSDNITFIESCKFFVFKARNYSNVEFSNNEVTGSASFSKESARNIYSCTFNSSVQIFNQAEGNSTNDINVYISNNTIGDLYVYDGINPNDFKIIIHSNTIKNRYSISVNQSTICRNVIFIGNRVRYVAIAKALINVDIIANKIGGKGSLSSLQNGINITLLSRNDRMENLRIFNNLIDSCNVAFNFSINGTSGSQKQDIDFRNNVIHDTNDSFSFTNVNSTTTFNAQNNIILNSSGSAEHLTNTTYYTNNNFFNAGTPPTGTDIISVDPQFVDAANGDFHLANGSPCIDIGASTLSFIDLDLTPNDMGIYGGPFSQENYEGVDARVIQVLFSNTTVSPGEDIIIKATGVSKGN